MSAFSERQTLVLDRTRIEEHTGRIADSNLFDGRRGGIRSLRLLLLVTLVAALIVTTTAAASRAPGTTEAKAIRTAVSNILSEPALAPLKRARVRSILVSTVDPRYARVDLAFKSRKSVAMLLHRTSTGLWWLQRFGSSLPCAAAPATVLRDLGIRCTGPPGVAWIPNCWSLQSAPTGLVLACADYNYRLESLTWRGWGRSGTTARGTARINDCKPDCAGGTFHSYAVRVLADRLRSCGRTPYYSQLVVTYVGHVPAGRRRRDPFELLC